MYSWNLPPPGHRISFTAALPEWRYTLLKLLGDIRRAGQGRRHLKALEGAIISSIPFLDRYH